jgi:hypothetical protein
VFATHGIPMTFARSSGEFASPPILMNVGPTPCTPVSSIDPTVAFIPNNAARVAGYTMDPSGSVPTDRGVKPAATPAPLPEDDPHEVRRVGLSSSFLNRGIIKRTLCPKDVALGSTPPRTYGDWVCPPRADHPAVISASLKFLHSCNAFSKVHYCRYFQHEQPRPEAS